jgi:zinc transport system substrate-binding protein
VNLLKISFSFICIFLFHFSVSLWAKQPVIVVSIPPQKEFVSSLIPGAKVIVMMPPYISPELFEPSFSSLQSLFQADAYIFLGVLPFENKIIQSLKGSTVKLLNSSQGLPLLRHDDHIDPHIWMSPDMAIAQVRNISQFLCMLYPERKKSIQYQEIQYIQKLHILDTALKQILTPSRSVLVYHPILGYPARRYGFRQIAIEQDGKIPSGKQLKAIIDDIQKNKMKYMIVSEQINPRIVNDLAKQYGLTVVTVSVISEYYLNSMNSFSKLLVKILK